MKALIIAAGQGKRLPHLGQKLLFGSSFIPHLPQQ